MIVSTKDFINIPQLNYSQKDYIDKLIPKINLTIHQIDNKTMVENKPIAYITKDSQNEYQIYKVGNRDGLLIHEVGHIIFQHLRFLDDKIKQTKQDVMNNWSKIEKNLSWREKDGLDAKISAYTHYIINLAQDMEVNSKLFINEDDKINLDKDLNLSLNYKDALLNNNSSFENLDLKKGCILPEDFGFQNQLDWQAYIILILADTDKFINDIKNQITEDFIDKDGNIKLEDLIEKDIIDDTSEVSSSSKETTKNNQEENNLPSRSIFEGNPNNVTTNEKLFNKDLNKFIKKNIIKNIKTISRNDYLYNYNRGKGGDTFTSKKIEAYQWMTKEIIVIIDVSGSVNINNINIALNELKMLKKVVGKHSRIILWDTGLVKDYDFSDNNIIIYAGGGTQLVGSFKYIKKYIKSSTSIFIISDFQDDLNQWYKVLNRFNFDNLYGIRWDDTPYIDTIFSPNKITKNTKNFFRKMKTLTVTTY